MDKDEMAQDLINFLNEMGQYTAFVDWMVERGSEEDEIEECLNKIEEG